MRLWVQSSTEGGKERETERERRIEKEREGERGREREREGERGREREREGEGERLRLSVDLFTRKRCCSRRDDNK
jgi:hypothetical protein